MTAQIARDNQLPAPRPNPNAISSRPVYEGWRTHRYGPPVTTVWSMSTWMKVLNDRPSVSTAQTRRARPTQITTTPATAKAIGAGVSNAGTHLRSRMPIQIDPARVRETITRVPRSEAWRPLPRTRSRTSSPTSHANQQ
jgi:hypothetical protein